MIAYVNGFLGAFISLGIGHFVLGLSALETLRCIAASNIAGLAALILILRFEAQPWIRRYVLTRSLRTWPLFLAMYYGFTLLMAPVLLNGRNFLWLVVPLALGNGFAIVVFGPIQDRIVRRAQRKAVMATANAALVEK